jgi:ribosomal 30S subunit maturation factor RimM
VHPLVDSAGTAFQPKALVYVVDEARQVLAGPLVVARRRLYHRGWLLGFAGVTTRDAVEPWRDRFLAVRESDARD